MRPSSSSFFGPERDVDRTRGPTPRRGAANKRSGCNHRLRPAHATEKFPGPSHSRRPVWGSWLCECSPAPGGPHLSADSDTKPHALRVVWWIAGPGKATLPPGHPQRFTCTHSASPYPGTSSGVAHCQSPSGRQGLGHSQSTSGRQGLAHSQSPSGGQGLAHSQSPSGRQGLARSQSISGGQSLCAQPPGQAG